MYPTSKDAADKYTLLRDSVRKKDLETARSLLQDNVPVNSISKVVSNTPLHWAVTNCCDMEFIALLIDKGANLNAINQHHQTPLHTAVMKNRVDFINLVINKNIDISEHFDALIMKALLKKDTDNIIKLLIDYASRSNNPPNIINAVNVAVRVGYVNVLTYLLDYCKTHKLNDQYICEEEVSKCGTKKFSEITALLCQYGFTIFSHQDEKNFKIIYSAVQEQCLEIVNNTLHLCTNINAINQETGEALLHVACMNKNAEMVKLLITFQAKLDIKVIKLNSKPNKNNLQRPEFNGQTPLHIAVHNCDLEIIKLLLINGAEIKEVPHLLSLAVEKSSKDVIQILLDYGADVNAPDKDGATPLYYSITKRIRSYQHFTYQNYALYYLSNDKLKKEIVKLLLTRGANPNINENNLCSPLQAAIGEGNLSVVKLLLKHNADINYSQKQGNTPLHLAIHGDAAILDVILEYNPNINAADEEGRTPLHTAAAVNKCDILEKLFIRNANIYAVDKYGNTALHFLCRKCSCVDAIKVLLNHNANVNAKNNCGETPFHILALHNSITRSKFNEEIFEKFLEYNADINAVDNEGRTPLAIVCNRPYEETMMEIFVKYGAYVNCKDSEGKTPLHLLVMNNNPKMFEFLLIHGADINSVCNNNMTALEYIKDNIILNQNTFASIAMFKIAREHIIKLECAKLPVNQKNLNLIYTDQDLQWKANNLVTQYRYQDIMDVSQIEHQCNDEIKALKCEKIGFSTLYKILIKNVHDLGKFARNEEIVHAFQSDNIDMNNKFPLYGSIITKKYFEAVKRSELLEIALNHFHSFIFYRLPYTCVDQIFCYFDLNDLKTLVNVINEIS